VFRVIAAATANFQATLQNFAFLKFGHGRRLFDTAALTPAGEG
jgi:hypothetical protein